MRGIADPTIMSDLLGDMKTDRTLEETVSFIAEKEQGRLTRSTVGDSAGTMNATIYNQKQPQAPGVKCWACGGPAHGQRNGRKPGQDTARLGHSQASNAQSKVITPKHVASALPVEHGVNVMHLLEYALKVKARATRPLKGRLGK